MGTPERLASPDPRPSRSTASEDHGACTLRIVVIGEEHVRPKAARHYEALWRHAGIRTRFFADDRSGLSSGAAGREGIEITRPGDPSRGVRALLRYWRDFRRVVDDFRPDVLEVYASINLIALLPMVLYARRRGIPIVIVCRGELYPPKFDAAGRVKRALLVSMLRSADLIVFKELYMERILEDLAPAVRRFGWSNAVPVREEPRWEREGNHLLFLNFFHPARNVDMVIRAAPLVHRELPDTQFHLVGSTRLLADRSEFYRTLYRHEAGLRELIHALDATDYVHIHPFSNEVDLWFAQAKVFLMPSDHVYCNYALLEAMERGVPPIISDERDPDARRIVSSGESGVLVPIDPEALARAILEILRDESERQRLGRGARARVVQDFNLAVEIGRLAYQYRSLAGWPTASGGS